MREGIWGFGDFWFWFWFGLEGGNEMGERKGWIGWED